MSEDHYMIEDAKLTHPVNVFVEQWDGISKPQLGAFDLSDPDNHKTYIGNGQWKTVVFKKIRLVSDRPLKGYGSAIVLMPSLKHPGTGKPLYPSDDRPNTLP